MQTVSTSRTRSLQKASGPYMHEKDDDPKCHVHSAVLSTLVSNFPYQRIEGNGLPNLVSKPARSASCLSSSGSCPVTAFAFMVADFLSSPARLTNS